MQFIEDYIEALDVEQNYLRRKTDILFWSDFTAGEQTAERTDTPAALLSGFHHFSKLRTHRLTDQLLTDRNTPDKGTNRQTSP